jgi:hypothetical protein
VRYTQYEGTATPFIVCAAEAIPAAESHDFELLEALAYRQSPSLVPCSMIEHLALAIQVITSCSIWQVHQR